MTRNKTDQKRIGPLLKKINVTSTTGKEKEEFLGFHIRKQTSIVKKEGRASIGGDGCATYILSYIAQLLPCRAEGKFTDVISSMVILRREWGRTESRWQTSVISIFPKKSKGEF